MSHVTHPLIIWMSHATHTLRYASRRERNESLRIWLIHAYILMTDSCVDMTDWFMRISHHMCWMTHSWVTQDMTDSCVYPNDWFMRRHDWFMGRSHHMCWMTHSWVTQDIRRNESFSTCESVASHTHMSHTHMSHIHLPIQVVEGCKAMKALPVCVCDMTYSCVCQPHSFVCDDACKCVTRLVDVKLLGPYLLLVCDTCYWCVTHVIGVCVTWLIRLCVMTHSCAMSHSCA